MLIQVKYQPGVLLHTGSFSTHVAPLPGLSMLRVTTLARSSSICCKPQVSPSTLLPNNCSVDNGCMGWRNRWVEGLVGLWPTGDIYTTVRTPYSHPHHPYCWPLCRPGSHLMLSPPAPCATLSSRQHYSIYPTQSSPPSLLLTVAQAWLTSHAFTTSSMRNIVILATLQYVPHTVIPTILAANHCAGLAHILCFHHQLHAQHCCPGDTTVHTPHGHSCHPHCWLLHTSLSFAVPSPVEDMYMS